MVLVFLVVAAILSAIEAFRSRSLGWGAIFFIALALAWPQIGTGALIHDPYPGGTGVVEVCTRWTIRSQARPA